MCEENVSLWDGLFCLIFGFGLSLQHSCGDTAVDGLVNSETFSSWAAREVCFVLGQSGWVSIKNTEE